jgi:uncharacterized protein with GYD domain
METYIILATLTDKGRQDIKGIIERRQKNLEQLQAAGIRIVADYAVMGEFDFLYIVEAPDNRTIMQQVVKDTTAGTLMFRTMSVVPMEQFASIAHQIKG